MERYYAARISTIIDASVAEVWEALVNPDMIRTYMPGTTVDSDWKKGSDIQWKGEWQGKTFEDRGTILQMEPEQVLQYTHYSPRSGLPDEPAYYHTVTIELTGVPRGIMVSLSQDNNRTEEERKHAERNWKAILDSLKNLLEQRSRQSGPGSSSA